jgi:hypothetical protein
MKKDQKKQGTPPFIPPQWGNEFNNSPPWRGISHRHSKERPLRRENLSISIIIFSLITFFYPENTGMIFYWTTHIEQLTRISFQVFTFILTFSHQGRRNYSDASS